MDFVKYVKPLLIFGHHLDPHFQQFEPLVTKFLVHKLSWGTLKKFTVKDSFIFTKEILHQDGKLFMGNLDVNSFFNICTNLLYNNENIIDGINKSGFKNLPSLATQEPYFIFENVLYEQKDDVAMGLPFEPNVAIHPFWRFLATNLLLFILWLIVVSKFVLIG